MVDLARYFEQLTQRGKRAVETARQRKRPSAPRGSGPAGRGRRTHTAPVMIEYTPRLDGDPDPGEVVWTWVPYEEDPTQGKDRPVIVIGRRSGRLVGIPLTTKRDDREVQVVVGTGAWDADRRTSYARIWRLLEIDPDRMRREGAVLERDRFDEVIDAVDDYYEVVHADTRS